MLGVDIEMPAEIGRGEKKIAIFCHLSVFCRLLPEFGDLLVHLVIDEIDRWPVKTDFGRLGLQFDRSCHGGKSDRHAIENALRPIGSRFLARLHFVPEAFGQFCRAGLLIAEYMRMAAYHLAAN